VLGHFVEYSLDSNVAVIHYSFVDISDDLLDHFELLEQLSSGFKYVFRKDILFTIDPEVGETLLSGI